MYFFWEYICLNSKLEPSIRAEFFVFLRKVFSKYLYINKAFKNRSRKFSNVFLSKPRKEVKCNPILSKGEAISAA